MDDNDPDRSSNSEPILHSSSPSSDIEKREKRGKPPGGLVQVSMVERSGKPFCGTQLVNPNQTTKIHDPTDLIELARVVQKADEFVRGTAMNKLSVIADQIRYLQQQARKVLEDAHRDNLLHHVACNFKKVPGKLYYLYERPSGQRYFSMLNPSEWGTSCPHRFLGAYRLEADMSWTPVEKIAERTEELTMLENILQAQKAFTETPVLTINSPLPLTKKDSSHGSNSSQGLNYSQHNSNPDTNESRGQ